MSTEFLDGEEVLEMDSSDGFTALWMHLMSLICLKMVKMVIYILCTFDEDKNILKRIGNITLKFDPDNFVYEWYIVRNLDSLSDLLHSV